MLRESVADGAFRSDRFGDAGLRAANPLFAFQLMNNFTLCHGAILAGLDGPNAAFFSRGAGTVRALREAAFAVAEADAPAALAGGADSALHPVTACELARGGHAGASVRSGGRPRALRPPRRATRVRLVRAEISSRVVPGPGNGAAVVPLLLAPGRATAAVTPAVPASIADGRHRVRSRRARRPRRGGAARRQRGHRRRPRLRRNAGGGAGARLGRRRSTRSPRGRAAGRGSSAAALDGELGVVELAEEAA